MLISSLSAKHEALKYYVSPNSMIKQKPYGDTLKAQLKASAKDRLHNFLLADGTIRGVILYGTRMVNEMRANHDLGIMETLVLGRAYLGIGLMSSNLKGDDQIRLQIDCSGPIRGLLVEANAFGEVRGFLNQVPIPIASPVENFDLNLLKEKLSFQLSKYKHPKNWLEVDSLKRSDRGKINYPKITQLALQKLKS